MYATPPRSQQIIDAYLDRVRVAKNRFPSGSLQWQGAMRHIDKLLDERLVAAAESMWCEEVA